ADSTASTYDRLPHSSPTRRSSDLPARPLEPGRYSFVATHEGMFGGRDFAYLRIVPPGGPVTAISSRPRAKAPAILDALLPLCARSEEHTSELQSLRHLVCRLLLEK